MLHTSVAHANTFMPPQASEVATGVDNLYGFLLWASLISFIVLIGGMIFFALRYKRKSFDQKTAYVTHNTVAEFTWSFLPFLLFMAFAAWGYYLFHEMEKGTDDMLEVQVFAKKWEWQFGYKNGRLVTNSVGENNEVVPATMVVPLNAPVRVVMTSIEETESSTPVLHSFFVPAFRVKKDVVPGMYTAISFTPTKKGEFQLFCTEYCGTGHSKMLGKIRVVEREEFERWLAGDGEGPGGGEESPAAIGRQSYTRYGCSGCHTLDGSPGVGPSFQGLFGSSRTFADGSATTADENYIRNSILNPNDQVVQGFPQGVMPSMKGQLQEEEISGIIEFIKTL